MSDVTYCVVDFFRHFYATLRYAHATLVSLYCHFRLCSRCFVSISPKSVEVGVDQGKFASVLAVLFSLTAVAKQGAKACKLKAYRLSCV